MAPETPQYDDPVSPQSVIILKRKQTRETCGRRLAFIALVLSLVFPACADKALGPVGAGNGSSLHQAVRSDNTAWVMDLIAKGAGIDETDSSGMTPLGIAVKRQNLEMVKLLLDRAANVRAGSGDYGAPLHLAVMGRGPDEEANVEIAELLIARGADLEALGPIPRWTPLHQAAAWDRVDMAELLIKKGANVNSRPRDPGGQTPLHTAVMVKRSLSMARLLVDHGADLRARDNIGCTPLDLALLNPRPSLDVVRLFLDHGADVDSRTQGGVFDWEAGATPLHRAVFHREIGIVELLISRGADVNAKNRMGKTPLALAKLWQIKFSNPEYERVIDLLRNHGGHE